MKMVLRPTLSFLFLFLIHLPYLYALEIPARPEGYVSDYAGMISPAARLRLEAELRRFEEETSNQVVVVTFPSLERGSLEDFSIRLAEAWKVGEKGKDNGVILIIFKEDRAVRIEVGYGLEGVLPDATSKLIIENEIVPRFREGKFDEGVERAVEAILAATRGEYQAGPPEAVHDSLVFAMVVGAFLGLTLPLLFLQLLLGFGMMTAIFGLGVGPRIIIAYGVLLGIFPLFVYFLSGRAFRNPMIMSGRGSHGGGWGGGFGGFGGGGFGGGGFSGGGGSFGGGGASGRW